MNFNKKEPYCDVMVMTSDDFKGYYNEELLAHLSDCKDIRFGDTLNFSTNIRFDGVGTIRVMDAFIKYLMALKKTVGRIIIYL